MATKWKEECGDCGHKHIVTLQSCPTCGFYETPQPLSEKVKENCHADYSCDGCQSYRDHY